MKLFISMAVALGAACGCMTVQAMPKEVHVTPGKLGALVSAADFADNDRLVITGTLNNSDIIVLRELCGRDSLGEPTPALVRRLDLVGVDFENSGAPYFARFNNTYSVTSRHALPPCIFYNVPVEELVLPDKTDTLGRFSLAYTALRELKVPAGVFVHPTAIAHDSLLSVLSLPAMEEGLSPRYYVLPGLRTITYGDLDYMPGNAFTDMPDLEEIIFDGIIGHVDGYQISGCPKLRRVVFNGPVLSTGGPVLAKDCPELESVEFNSVVGGLGLVQYVDCPRLKGITVNGAVIESADTARVADTSLADVRQRPELVNGMERLGIWLTGSLNRKGFLGKVARWYAPEMTTVLDTLGMPDLAARVDSVFQARRDPDEGKTKLQILKESAPYSRFTGEVPRITYTQPDDSLLTRSREYFNLDSIAGNGDDVSRIKNLLYWVHDLVSHDGSSAWPDCRFNLVDLYEICRREQRGLNCRFMAMMLTEALLAEGIPARYLTCQSKAYDDDTDCHVITVAWSESLGKWIWVDPTFCAYVTDENGMLLHPGEVRYRLQNDMPLVLNDDANWNHRSKQTKEEYLENYMAKNLYVISTNLIQQSEPEGASDHPQGGVMALVPDGFEYPYGVVISDDTIFWQKP